MAALPAPPPREGKRDGRTGHHAPPPSEGVPTRGSPGGRPQGGPLSPLRGSRGAGPRGRSPPRPGEEGLPPPPCLPGSPLRPRAGPRSPTLRANPFPEVTDPFCRLPLPTLFRWLEALHLGDLMRLWVRPGGEHDRRPPGFHGPVGGLPNAPKTGAPCQPSGPLSGRADSRAVRTRPASDARGCQGGKRTLLGASTGVPGLPRVAASVRPPPSVRGS